MNWCLIIPIIVGVICAILGYLLGRLFSKKNTTDTSELETWKQKYEALTKEHNSCKNKRLALEAELAACTTKLQTNVSAPVDTATSFAALVVPFDTDAAKAVFGKKIKQDDLKVVEGIGPKIEELFHNHDIKTWKALSESSVEECQKVLKSGGKRFEIHKPGTWPRQAKLAYEGKWEELLKWQDELDGGK